MLREALVVVLGTDFRIETMVDAGTARCGPARRPDVPAAPTRPSGPATPVPDAPLGQSGHRVRADALGTGERAVASVAADRPT